MICSTPGCGGTKIMARGLCQGCYHRLRRNGTIERKYVVNTGSCSVDGCGKKSFAKNLCQTHYQQEKHPLHHSWKLLRSRSPGAYPAEWDRFTIFIRAVGERPTPKHQLRRIDPNCPWSAQNFHWVAPITNRFGDYYTKEQRSEYSREWSLKKKYSISAEEYSQLLNGQNGVCAICQGIEKHKYPSGKIRDFAVDHDHETGAIRGLLCTNCNRAIGYLGDSPERLRAAADYLERYARAKLVCDDANPPP